MLLPKKSRGDYQDRGWGSSDPWIAHLASSAEARTCLCVTGIGMSLLTLHRALLSPPLSPHIVCSIHTHTQKLELEIWNQKCEQNCGRVKPSEKKHPRMYCYWSVNCQIREKKSLLKLDQPMKSISLQSLKLAWFEVGFNSLTVLFCLFLMTAGLRNVSKTMLLPLCCQQNVQRCSNMFQRSLEPWTHSETIAVGKWQKRFGNSLEASYGYPNDEVVDWQLSHGTAMVIPSLHVPSFCKWPPPALAAAPNSTKTLSSSVQFLSPGLVTSPKFDAVTVFRV